MKRVTIHDVAAGAGVSYQTVSRVLNHRPDVADETRQRVNQIIQELGYQPSAIARGLVTQRSHLLGLVTIDYEDYFYSGVCNGVQEEAHAHGYMLIIVSTCRDNSFEIGYIQQLIRHGVDGIVLVRDTIQQSYLASFQPIYSGLPLVLACFRHPGEISAVVDIDNEDGGRQVANLFLRNGHYQVAMITAPSHYDVTSKRSGGFLSAYREAGIELDPELIVEGDWHYDGGYRAAKALLSSNKQFTAVFAHNDSMAIGALRVFREAGLRVPEDISLVGYDDLPVSGQLDPPLTSVWQPRHETGAEAVRLLIGQINEKQAGRTGSIQLKPKLVERQTVQMRLLY
jgi:LacI family transcriptional regulator